MNKNTKIIAAAVAVVLIGASFYGGMVYGKSTVSGRGQFAAGAGAGGSFRTGAMGGGMMRTAGGGFATGEILSKDANSITLKMQDGSSKIVLISGSTTVLTSTAGTADDLAAGASVTVTGTTNSDGSISAQTVQVRPAGVQR